MAERLLKTVFDWEHFAIYLSGSMDFANDGGKGWREEWTNKLVDIGINSKQIYNPCKKPFNGAQFDLDDEAAIAKKCRKNEDWDGLDKVMGQIMHVDCRLVDKADIILVNFPLIDESHPAIQKWNKANAALRLQYGSDLSGVQMDAGYNLKEALSSMRIPTYGTIHEIVIAHQQRKPIFIVWEETGKTDCSAWLMKLVGYKNIFAHVDPLIKHLQAISQGKKSFDANEWLLLDPK